MSPTSSLPSLFVFALGAKQVLAVRQITVNNKCPAPIYVSIGSPSGGALAADGSPQPASWMQQVGEYEFTVPDDWKDGRVWAQTGCDSATGTPNCKIGNCGGGVCDGKQYGTPGATLAEFGFSGYAGQDFYDISMVDGYNLPMQIDVQGGNCPTASCGVQQDIIEICDPSLVYPKGSNKMYSCGSACIAGVQFQQGTSGSLVSADMADTPVCCQHAGVGVAATDCPNTYIPFYKQMKELCHDGYIYPKDDMYPGSILACPGSGNPSYTVTFCPNGVGAGLNPPDVASCSPMDSTPGDNAGNLEGGGSTSPVWGQTLKGEVIPGADAGAGTGTSNDTGNGSSSGKNASVNSVSNSASQPLGGTALSSAGAIPSAVPSVAAGGASVPPPLSSSSAQPYALASTTSSAASEAVPPAPPPSNPVPSGTSSTSQSDDLALTSSTGSLFIPGVSSIPSAPDDVPVAGPPAPTSSSSSVLSSASSVPAPAGFSSLGGPLNLAITSTSTSSGLPPATSTSTSKSGGGSKWGGGWGSGNWRRMHQEDIGGGGGGVDNDPSGHESREGSVNGRGSRRLEVLVRHRERRARRRRAQYKSES
ncbi:hypothetical protein IAU59_000163 [Kwoniella sp. CBS 9459]